MNITRLHKGNEQQLEQFLSRHTETSMFLRSNMLRAGLEFQDKEFHGEYFGAFDIDNNIIGVLAHYWNNMIMMQSINQENLRDLCAIFRKAVSRPVAGVLGENDQAKVVIQELDIDSEAFSANKAEGLFSLHLKSLTIPSNIDFDHTEMVDAPDIERSILTRWMKAYAIEALGYEDNETLVEITTNRVNSILNGTDLWALVTNGKPVSLSGFNAALPDIVQVGPVWTPPEYRNRGYARALVALTLQKAKEQGVRKAILFTDSPAAIKAYEAIGFNQIGSYRLALFKEPVNL